ncbi:MAG: HAD-IA family hydrolase [Bacillota bacterium]
MLLIFDFDGVILDSSADIANAANYTLEHFGFRRLPNTTIKALIGHGARDLVRRSFAEANGQEPFVPENAYDTYLNYYMENAVVESKLYPNIISTLAALNERGDKCAILTNKPEPLTKKICIQLGIDKYFEYIIGPESLEKMKPNPEGILKLLAATKVLPSEAMMIGDSDSDIMTGRAAGVKTCAVTYGIGDLDKLLLTKPDMVIDDAWDLV